MRKATPKAPPRTPKTPTDPINFRMPQPLRERLRRYAAARHLGEAEALRVVVSERLTEIEREHDLAAAERWQLDQAYATWDRLRRGGSRPVPREGVSAIFTDALAGRERTLKTT